MRLEGSGLTKKFSILRSKMTSSSSSSTSFCNIRVLVGLAEHNYSLSPDTTMQAVVEMILKDEKVVKPMKVRLIHKGKALHQRGTIQSNGIGKTKQKKQKRTRNELFLKTIQVDVDRKLLLFQLF